MNFDYFVEFVCLLGYSYWFLGRSFFCVMMMISYFYVRTLSLFDKNVKMVIYLI